MWPIWFRSEISSGKDFEILWKFVIFQVFISTVLSNLHSTDVILPLYWIPSIVLMLSPTVLMLSPHMYWCHPPMYWIPSTVLKLSPHCTDVILTYTVVLYWTTSTVLKVSPTVLKVSPTCTAVIPPQYWRYPSSTEGIPPQYWCYPSTVLM